VGYDVDWKSKDGAEHSFSLDDGGKLSSVQLAPQELPPAVQASMVKEIDPAKIKDIEKTFDDNTVLYEITFDKDGVERAITYEESGRMESRQVLLTEVPPPVQNTIKHRACLREKKGRFLVRSRGRQGRQDVLFQRRPEGGISRDGVRIMRPRIEARCGGEGHSELNVHGRARMLVAA
jgi:hypothetical protein